MQVGNLLHKWNVENDQACNKLPTSFQLVRLWVAALTEDRSQLGDHVPVSTAFCSPPKVKCDGCLPSHLCELPVWCHCSRTFCLIF